MKGPTHAQKKKLKHSAFEKKGGMTIACWGLFISQASAYGYYIY